MVFAIDLWSISAKKCSDKTDTGIKITMQVEGGRIMAELMIDIYEYLTDDQIKEICKEEFRRQIRIQFANNTEATNKRLIGNIAYQVVFEEISAYIGADAWSILKDTVAKIMQDEGAIRYVLFQRKDDFTYKNSPAVDMMDEITAENRGLMEQKVREAIEKFEFCDVQDEIYEVAREVIYKRIFGKEDKNNADA